MSVFVVPDSLHYYWYDIILGGAMSQAHILQRFHEEVMKTGPEATLPSNLNDFWLDELHLSLEELFESMEGQVEKADCKGMSLPLAAIVHILFAKNNGAAMEASMEEMFKYFEDYRLELALELVRRNTDLDAEPATICSIFTNRVVCVSDAIDPRSRE